MTKHILSGNYCEIYAPIIFKTCMVLLVQWSSHLAILHFSSVSNSELKECYCDDPWNWFSSLFHTLAASCHKIVWSNFGISLLFGFGNKRNFPMHGPMAISNNQDSEPTAERSRYGSDKCFRTPILWAVIFSCRGQCTQYFGIYILTVYRVKLQMFSVVLK